MLRRVALLAGLALVACGELGRTTGGRRSGGSGTNTNQTLQRVSIELAPTVKLGTSIQGKLRAFTADGRATEVSADATWASSAETVATISPTGLVMPLAIGKTTITASYRGLSAAVELNVLDPSDAVNTLLVAPHNASIAVGASQMFTATAVYNSGIQREVTASAVWTVANTSLFRVDGPGLVTALVEGQTSLAVSYDGAMGQTNVTSVDQGGSGTMSNFDPADLTARLANARCTYYHRCRSLYYFVNGWLNAPQGTTALFQHHRDLEVCRARETLELADFYVAMKSSAENNRVRFQPSVFDACLANLMDSNSSCTAAAPDELCYGAFTGLRANDEGCQHSVECGSGSFCETSFGACGSCKPKVRAGQECFNYGGECVDGAVCAKAIESEYYCVRTGLDRGEPCGTVTTGLCAAALICTYSEATQRNECATSMTGFRRERGESCTPNAERSECDSLNNLVCAPVVNGGSTNETYVCTDAVWYGAGTRIANDRSNFTCGRLQCLPFDGERYHQVQNERFSCGCDALPSVGESCGDGAKCRGLANSCQIMNGSLLCAPRGGEGQACTLDGDCEERYLCGLSSTCEKFNYRECF